MIKKTIKVGDETVTIEFETLEQLIKYEEYNNKPVLELNHMTQWNFDRSDYLKKTK